MSLSTLVRQLRQIAAEGESAVGALEAGAEETTTPSVVQAPPMVAPPAAPLQPPTTSTPDFSGKHKAGGGPFIWVFVGVAVLVLIGSIVLYLVLRKKGPEAPPPHQPPAQLPSALQQRMTRLAEQRLAEEREQQDEQDHQEEDARTAHPPRHVRFDDAVTEYPIPARRMSRRAGGGAMEDLQAARPSEDTNIPQIRIDMSQRFEG